MKQVFEWEKYTIYWCISPANLKETMQGNKALHSETRSRSLQPTMISILGVLDRGENGRQVRLKKGVYK